MAGPVGRGPGLGAGGEAAGEGEEDTRAGDQHRYTRGTGEGGTRITCDIETHVSRVRVP